jgi:hypothetical protein
VVPHRCAPTIRNDGNIRAPDVNLPVFLDNDNTGAFKAFT